MARPVEFKEKEVLDNAMRQFWKEGYEASSVHKLIRCTGINRGSMYNSFGNKKDLFRLCLEHYAITIIKPLLDKSLLDKGLDHWDSIRNFFGMSIASDLGRGCLLVNTLCGAEVYNKEIFKHVDELLGVIRKALVSRLRECSKRDGGLKAGITVEFAADVLMGALHSVRVRSRWTKPHRSTKNLAGFAIQSLCKPSK